MVDPELRVVYYFLLNLRGVKPQQRWKPPQLHKDLDAAWMFVERSKKMSGELITPENMRKLMQMIVDERQ